MKELYINDKVIVTNVEDNSNFLNIYIGMKGKVTRINSLDTYNVRFENGLFYSFCRKNLTFLGNKDTVYNLEFWEVRKWHIVSSKSEIKL